MNKIFLYGWEILKISWKANGFLSILSIFSAIYQNTLFPFFQVFLLAQVLDLVQNQRELSLSILIPLVCAYIIFSVINIFLSSLVTARGYYIETNFEAYLDRMVIDKLTMLDPATFEKSSFQELLSQIEGTGGLMSAQLERLTKFISAIVKVITASIVLLHLFPLFIPIVLISVIPAYLSGDRSRKREWPFFTTKRSVVKRVTQYIKNLLSQDSTSKEVAVFHTGSTLRHKVSDEQLSYIREYKKVNNPFMMHLLFSKFFQLCVFIYTQYANLLAVARGTLGVGQFALAFQQTLNLATGSQDVLDMYSSMMNRTQQIDRFFAFLKYKPVILSPNEPIAIPINPTPPIIDFKNVTFRYPKTERDILRNFNFTLNPGEKLALVGENGAGKTTIIKLLLRFYDVTEGEIVINGVNIKNLSLEEWHKHVGALFQDFIKYQFTFKENVYFGNLNEKNNEELLRDAIAKSGADKYINALPKNIDQIVGKMFDNGIDLSGGQWQKLALARAFFRDAPILILDEPTSAIDAKAEYEIFQNVQKLQKDKTVLIISHRFSTVRNADRILVLDSGKIIEEGNHEKLMKEKGLYAELFDIQAQGYK